MLPISLFRFNEHLYAAVGNPHTVFSHINKLSATQIRK